MSNLYKEILQNNFKPRKVSGPDFYHNVEVFWYNPKKDKLMYSTEFDTWNIFDKSTIISCTNDEIVLTCIPTKEKVARRRKGD